MLNQKDLKEFNPWRNSDRFSIFVCCQCQEPNQVYCQQEMCKWQQTYWVTTFCYASPSFMCRLCVRAGWAFPVRWLSLKFLMIKGDSTGAEPSPRLPTWFLCTTSTFYCMVHNDLHVWSILCCPCFLHSIVSLLKGILWLLKEAYVSRPFDASL